jgi:hypothetical protein
VLRSKVGRSGCTRLHVDFAFRLLQSIEATLSHIIIWCSARLTRTIQDGDTVSLASMNESCLDLDADILCSDTSSCCHGRARWYVWFIEQRSSAQSTEHVPAIGEMVYDSLTEGQSEDHQGRLAIGARSADSDVQFPRVQRYE